MGQSPSIRKVNFEDVQYAIKQRQLYLLINTGLLLLAHLIHWVVDFAKHSQHRGQFVQRCFDHQDPANFFYRGW